MSLFFLFVIDCEVKQLFVGDRFRFQIEKKGCGYANQEVRIVGGKPTGINVSEIFENISNTKNRNLIGDNIFFDCYS